MRIEWGGCEPTKTQGLSAQPIKAQGFLGVKFTNYLYENHHLSQVLRVVGVIVHYGNPSG